MNKRYSVFARGQIISRLAHTSLDVSIEETLQSFNEQGKK